VALGKGGGGPQNSSRQRGGVALTLNKVSCLRSLERNGCCMERQKKKGKQAAKGIRDPRRTAERKKGRTGRGEFQKGRHLGLP